MKNNNNSITMWVAIMMIGLLASVAYGGEIRHTVQLNPECVSTDTVTSPDGSLYIRLSAPECQYVGNPGEPMIPYKIVRFLVPTYSNNFSVEIESKTIGDTMSLTLPVYPIQKPVSYNDYTPDMFTQLNSDLYANNIKPAVVVDDFIVNGNQRIVSVGISIAAYRESTSQIDMVRSMSFKLKYSDCTADDLDFIPISRPSSSLDMDLNGFVVNPPALSANNTDFSRVEKEIKHYYYILVPEYLKESIYDLAMWKRQKGYNVMVKTVEEIVNDKSYELVNGHESFDKESHIRNWLISETEKKGSFHLLIIGDEKAGAPIRKFHTDSLNKKDPYFREYNGANFVPTDGYFSDVSSKFILNERNGEYYTGFTEDQPIAPCLPVGRILASEAVELERYMKKLFIYENDPGLGDSEYLGNAMAFLQSDMIYYNEKTLIPYIPHYSNVSFIKDYHNNDTYTENRPTGKEVIDVMKTCGLISMHGHGSPFTIRCSGARGGDYRNHRYIVSQEAYGTDITGHIYCESGNGLDNLDNAASPSVAYSIACEICPFEIYKPKVKKDKIGKYNMGSGFTVAGDYGGVAFIGNTRDGYITRSDNLEQEFGKFVNNQISIGASLVNSSVSRSLLGWIDKHCIFTRCLIGTPDIKIWLGAPLKFEADITASNGQLNFFGNDLENSQIVIYNGREVLSSKTCMLKNSFTADLSSFERQYGKDFVVSLYKDGRLPLTFLIANGSIVANERKTYFFRDADIHNRIDSNLSCFSVVEGGRLDISCTRGLKSNKAFEIGLGGEVNINSMSKVVTLSGDIVENRGILNINAEEVILDKAFTVDQGGYLEISINKY